MAAFLGISLWIALATVVPGLLVSFQMARIRLEVMAKVVWAVRRRRLAIP